MKIEAKKDMKVNKN